MLGNRLLFDDLPRFQLPQLFPQLADFFPSDGILDPVHQVTVFAFRIGDKIPGFGLKTVPGFSGNVLAF